MSIYHNAAAGGNDLCGNVRFHHQTNKVHALGPRPGGEMLAKLVRLHPEIAPTVGKLLDEYSAIDAAFIKQAGLDRWTRCLVLVPSNAGSVRIGAASRSDIMKATLDGGDHRQ
jgi:hypothetical protein